MRIQLLGGIAAQGAGMLSPTAPYYALIYSLGTSDQGPGDFLHPAEPLPYTCTSRARSCSYARPETAALF
jgi:hypothetical protein